MRNYILLMGEKHKWTFFRAGGFDQVKLDSGAAFMNLSNLDQKLWVALACPTKGLEIDARTLELIDSDKDGRVRVRELIAAVEFAGNSIKNPDDLLKGDSALPLSSFNDSTPEGRTLLSSARQILRNIGKAEAQSISIEDVSDTTRIFAATAFNGDGKITVLSASTDAARTLIQEIIDCMGGEPDLSGRPGLTAEKIEAFFEDAKSLETWFAEGESATTEIFPLGPESTRKAVAALEAIQIKVDDYFARCRLLAYDPRAERALNRNEDEYLAVVAKDMSLSASEIAGFPLSRITIGQPLPLSGSVNPAHAEALARLSSDTVTPLLGPRKELSETHWTEILSKLASFRAWMSRKPRTRLEQLGEARIQEILASNLRATLESLLDKDNALQAETQSIEKVERLVRYYRDIALLCTNFVNFKDFYDGDEPAIFQAGTLFLDQRECRLCMRVEDSAKHALMAGLAGAYLAYLDCVRPGSSGAKMQIVVAFTAGDGDNLMVGRNGLFYDRKGNDWDATIVKIVDNPISIRQAFWAPYKKFVRYLEEQVNKRAAAADAESQARLSATATAAVNADTTKLPPPPQPKKIDVGTVAAIGVAAGAIGTFFTAMIGYATGVFKLGFFPTIGAIIGLLALISLPSVVMAYIKLRKRNLGPILDANGWAVNAKAKINVPFGATLSSIAKLPPGSRRDSSDPYAEKDPPWKRIAFVIFVIYISFSWYKGSFNRLLPDFLHPTEVLGKWAPGSTTPK